MPEQSYIYYGDLEVITIRSDDYPYKEFAQVKKGTKIRYGRCVRIHIKTGMIEDEFYFNDRKCGPALYINPDGWYDTTMWKKAN